MTEAEKKIREETIKEIINFMEDGAWRTEVVHMSIPGKNKIDRACNTAADKAVRSEIESIKYNFTGDGVFVSTKFVTPR